MRITSKGQVTIPLHIRQRHGLLPNAEVDFVEDGDDVKIVARPADDDRAARAIAALRGRADTHLSTEEIMALTRD